MIHALWIGSCLGANSLHARVEGTATFGDIIYYILADGQVYMIGDLGCVAN